MSRKEVFSASFFFLLLTILFFHSTFLTSLTYFAGDLTYYWHPKKYFIVESLLTGHFPLWDPSFRCGIPFFAFPDNGVLDPFSILFNFFSFSSALKIFQLITFWISCFGCFLVGRILRWNFLTSIFLGTLFVFGGYFIVRSQFVSELSTLMWGIWAALFLLSRSYVLFSIVFTFSIFSGQWQMVILFSLVAVPLVFLHLLKSRGCFLKKEEIKKIIFAAMIIAGFSAIQTFPTFELIHSSSWGKEGISIEQRKANSLTFKDLKGFVMRENSESDERKGIDNSAWTRSFLIGFFPLFLSISGFISVPFTGKLISAFFIVIPLLFSLGGSNPLSSFLIEHLFIFSYIRYPARWILSGYLVFILLGCYYFNGLSKRIKVAILILSVIQLFYGWDLLPKISKNIFYHNGPLAPYLQEHLNATKRFFFSPKTERILCGLGADFPSMANDLRSRLYVRIPLLFHLNQAGGFGEPLIPKSCDDLTELIGKQKTAEAAKNILSRAGVSDLLSSELWEKSGFKLESNSVWNVYHNDAALPRTYTLSDNEFQATESLFSEREQIQPVITLFHNEKIVIEGDLKENEGWLILSDTFYPGWKAYVNRRKETIILDGGFFRAVKVPRVFKTQFIYSPGSFLGGIFLTLSAIGVLFFMGMIWVLEKKKRFRGI